MKTRRIRMHALLERLAERGLPDAAIATTAARATLRALGERFVDDEAALLAEVLPDELARVVDNVEHDASLESTDLFERVRLRERSSGAAAKEHAEIVLAALGELMDHERKARLARGLPPRVAAVLMGDREQGAPPPYTVRPRAAENTTLAAGRPGARHPLSDARAPAGQIHSVACNPSPHEDTKLSTSRGLTQERFHETLGEGRPGPARGLAGRRGD